MTTIPEFGTLAYALDREPELVRRLALLAGSRLETGRADLAVAVALLAPLVGSQRGLDVIPAPRATDEPHPRRMLSTASTAFDYLTALRAARAAETLTTAEAWLRSPDAWHVVWGYAESLLRLPRGRTRLDAHSAATAPEGAPRE
ncbi:hypothetical protein [Demequina maris]|uniref:hypothetical protein n=1 Tax=Demequina maris TaxID=1638982 RepID=UPI000AAE4437|nr:hypothetical protein [Demequina maris]